MLIAHPIRARQLLVQLHFRVCLKEISMGQCDIKWRQILQTRTHVYTILAHMPRASVYCSGSARSGQVREKLWEREDVSFLVKA